MIYYFPAKIGILYKKQNRIFLLKDRQYYDLLKMQRSAWAQKRQNVNGNKDSYKYARRAEIPLIYNFNVGRVDTGVPELETKKRRECSMGK